MSFLDWLEEEYEDVGGPEFYFDYLINSGTIEDYKDITCYMLKAWDARYENLTTKDI